MNINNVNLNKNLVDISKTQNTGRSELEKENKEVTSKDIAKDIPAVIYEKNQAGQAKGIYNKEAVLKLKEQTEANKAKIIKMIQDSLGRQGIKIGLATNNPELAGITNIDAKAREEAEAMLAEDGELGVEKTSQRIVDFAKAISGGNKAKAGILRDAIDKGFKEAEKMLGGKLPQISQDTYDRTMELFDKWANEGKEIEED